MRKRMVVGIALLLLVLRAHKMLISLKLAYRSSINRLKILMRYERRDVKA